MQRIYRNIPFWGLYPMTFEIFNFVYFFCLESLQQERSMYISFVFFTFWYIYIYISYSDMYYLCYIYDIERERYFPKLLRLPTILLCWISSFSYHLIFQFKIRLIVWSHHNIIRLLIFLALCLLLRNVLGVKIVMSTFQ